MPTGNEETQALHKCFLNHVTLIKDYNKLGNPFENVYQEQLVPISTRDIMDESLLKPWKRWSKLTNKSRKAKILYKKPSNQFTEQHADVKKYSKTM